MNAQHEALKAHILEKEQRELQDRSAKQKKIEEELTEQKAHHKQLSELGERHMEKCFSEFKVEMRDAQRKQVHYGSWSIVFLGVKLSKSIHYAEN